MLLPKTKKGYFQNINAKDLSDSKKFWKTIKPYFSNKTLNSNKMLQEAATDMKYFARRKFSRSLVLKKFFSLIWQVVFSYDRER